MKTIATFLASALLAATGSPAHSEPLAQRTVELSNTFFSQHLPVLTFDLVGLHINLPRGTARVRLGGGDTRFADLRVSSDVNVVDGAAHIHAHVALAVAGQRLAFRLPEIDIQQTNARDNVDKPIRGLEVVMPLAREHF